MANYLDYDGLSHLKDKLDSRYATSAQGTKADNAIPNPQSKSNGQVLTYNGTNWVADDPAQTGVLTVTAGNDTITIGGTSANPTVAVTTNKFDAYGSASTVDAKLNENVSVKPSGDFFSVDGDTVTFTASYKNLKTGTTSTKEEVIDLADEENAGFMSPSDYNQIRDNTSRIEALEGQTKRLLYTTKENPTAQEISAFVTQQGYTENLESIAVVVSGTYHIWHYYTGTGWKDDGIDTVVQFTNSTAGIIKGAGAVAGKVFAENDGTGSVYGWDALVTRVGNAESSLSNKLDSTVAASTYWAQASLVAITNSQIDTIFE